MKNFFVIFFVLVILLSNVFSQEVFKPHAIVMSNYSFKTLLQQGSNNEWQYEPYVSQAYLYSYNGKDNYIGIHYAADIDLSVRTYSFGYNNFVYLSANRYHTTSNVAVNMAYGARVAHSYTNSMVWLGLGYIDHYLYYFEAGFMEHAKETFFKYVPAGVVVKYVNNQFYISVGVGIAI